MKIENYQKISITILVIVLMSVLLGASTCNKDNGCNHKLIEIRNNSLITINWRHFTPDSIYMLNGSEPASDLIVYSNSSENYGTRDCWDNIFKDGYSMYFLIFNNDSVQFIGWKAISGTNRGLLKRVKVDSTYLMNNNYVITYP